MHKPRICASAGFTWKDWVVVILGFMSTWIVIFVWGGTDIKDFAVETVKWVVQSYISDQVIASSLVALISAVIGSAITAIWSYCRGPFTVQQPHTDDETTSLLESKYNE